MSDLDDTKSSDGEISVLELWGMLSTSSLPLVLGSLCPEVLPVKVPSMGRPNRTI